MRNLTMQNTRTRLSVAIASALLATSGVAQAQLEEIVVTAQKREQNLQDVPISVAVVSAETLEKQNINDTISLALSVPSITFQAGYAPSASSFTIRGVSSYTLTGGIQPSVSMVVDGVALARPGEFLAELPDIERIEVLRGPQGTLFGRNSIGGVINITSRAASDELTGNISYSYTDEEEHLLTGFVSGPISDSVKYSIAGFTRDRDDFIENINPKGVDAGGQESWGGRAKLDVDFSDNVNAVFSVDYRELDWSVAFNPDVATDYGPEAGGTLLRELALGNGDPALGREVLADRFMFNGNEREDGDAEMENWGLSADITWAISDSLTLKSITAYREWEEAANVDVDGSGSELANGGYGLPLSLSYSNLDDDYVGIPLYRDFENEWVTQELRLESTGDSADWVLGVFYQDFEEGSRTNFHLWIPFVPEVGGDLLSSQLSDVGTELTAASIFGDVTFHLSDTLDVYGGLRIAYEDVEARYDTTIINAPGFLGVYALDPATNSVNIDTSHPLFSAVVTGRTLGTATIDDTDWSGRLGFNWNFSEDASLYGQISRGYVGIGTTLDPSGTPDTAFVDPTTAEAIEFGVKSELFDGRLRLNSAIFYQEVSDLQASIFPPGGFNTQNINAGDTETFGLEVDALWAVNEYMQLSAAVTYLDIEIQDLLQACYPGQTLATGCNLDSFGNVTNDPMMALQTDVAGAAPPNAPELAYNIAADFFAPLGNLPFEGYARIAYTWQDDITFALNNDPLLTQEAYGLLDITMGISDKEGRYDISLFAKNATDEEFINDAIDLDVLGSRRSVRMGRGARDYYGIKLQWNFGAL